MTNFTVNEFKNSQAAIDNANAPHQPTKLSQAWPMIAITLALSVFVIVKIAQHL